MKHSIQINIYHDYCFWARSSFGLGLLSTRLDCGVKFVQRGTTWISPLVKSAAKKENGCPTSAYEVGNATNNFSEANEGSWWFGRVHVMKRCIVITGCSCCVFEGFGPINPCIFKKTLPNCVLHLPNHPLLFCFVWSWGDFCQSK